MNKCEDCYYKTKDLEDFKSFIGFYRGTWIEDCIRTYEEGYILSIEVDREIHCYRKSLFSEKYFKNKEVDRDEFLLRLFTKDL